jgi:hypothetical protein
MTTLRWMTRFDHVQVQRTGVVGNVCWMHVAAWNVGDPGVTPEYMVVERADGQTRVIPNLTDAERAAVMADPLAFWERDTSR